MSTKHEVFQKSDKIELERMQRKVRFVETAKQIHIPREKLCEITGATQPQIKSWMDGYEAAKAFIEGKGSYPTANKNYPEKVYIDRLEKGVLLIAENILIEAREVEGQNPLSREQFLEGWHDEVLDIKVTGNLNELEGLLLVVGDQDNPTSLTTHVRGRTGHLGHVTIRLDGKTLPDDREWVINKVWQQYQDWTAAGSNKPVPSEMDEFRSQKGRYADALQMLDISNVRLAEMVGLRTEEDNVNRSQRGVDTVRLWCDMSSPLFPPSSVLSIFQAEVQKWAHYLVYVATTTVGEKLIVRMSYPLSKVGETNFAKIDLESLNSKNLRRLSKTTRQLMADKDPSPAPSAFNIA